MAGLLSQLEAQGLSAGAFTPLGAGGALSPAEAASLTLSGNKTDLEDRIFDAYKSFGAGKDAVVVDAGAFGPAFGIPAAADARLAAELGAPVVLVVDADGAADADALATKTLLAADAFASLKARVTGAVLQGVPDASVAAVRAAVADKLAAKGLTLAGVLGQSALAAGSPLESGKGASGAAPFDAAAALASATAPPPAGYKVRRTPRMFAHDLATICKSQLQHVVLPESGDLRVLEAAAEVTKKGLARVTLLGDPETVRKAAAEAGVDLTGVEIEDYVNDSERKTRYATLLASWRKAKGMTEEQALEALTKDMNMYGTVMVRAGDADGMVSGAACTTANTIRPALQILKTPDKQLVSSVFFMCLPDEVLVYGDCAVVVDPSPEELAQIAVVSAGTAAAFGVPPRVALLSYSTLGSGSGPLVDKVQAAVDAAKTKRPDLAIEGPIQYDAAVDMSIASKKIKGGSPVAGQATVCIFPDLDAGNACYKAVQQSTGAVAIGPLMQGLARPVNDLSRGCTVPDIVNTVACTAVQAIALKESGVQAQ